MTRSKLPPPPDTLVIFDPRWSPPAHAELLRSLDDGDCVNTDPALFFPERGSTDDVLEAQKICTGCQVRIECLRFAVLNTERRGVWGQTSEDDRRRMFAGRFPRWGYCKICQQPFWRIFASQATCGEHT